MNAEISVCEYNASKQLSVISQSYFTKACKLEDCLKNEVEEEVYVVLTNTYLAVSTTYIYIFK